MFWGLSNLIYKVCGSDLTTSKFPSFSESLILWSSGAKGNDSHIYNIFLMVATQALYPYSHFTDKETEAQRGYM